MSIEAEAARPACVVALVDPCAWRPDAPGAEVRRAARGGQVRAGIQVDGHLNADIVGQSVRHRLPAPHFSPSCRRFYT